MSPILAPSIATAFLVSGGVDPRGLSAGSAASPETDYAVALCGAEKAAKDIAKPRTYCAPAGRAIPFACRRRLAVSSILHAQGPDVTPACERAA